MKNKPKAHREMSASEYKRLLSAAQSQINELREQLGREGVEEVS